MRSRRKLIGTAIVVGLIAAVYGAITAPRLSPACDELREKTEQLALSDSSLSGVIIAIAVPAESLDKAYLERAGKMTDEQCTANLAPVNSAYEALSHTPWGPRMARAGEQAKEAIRECREKREAGDLKSHAESAACSNPSITQAFQAAGYPYTDLLAAFAKRRVEMAAQVDKSMLSDAEDSLDVARLALEISLQESDRVTGLKK